VAIDRLPGGPWGRTWLVALAIALVLLGGWEGFLRARGFRPSLTDFTAGGPESWTLERNLARWRSPETIIVLGASRAEHGIVPEVLARETGTPHPIVLTVTGSSLRPVLHDLAMDPAVRNPILCSLNTVMFFDATHLTEQRPREWLPLWRAMTTAQATEEWLSEAVACHLALRHPILAPSSLLAAAWEGRFPTPQYFVVRPDRSVRADHSKFHRFQYAPFDTLEEFRAFTAHWYATSGVPANGEELQRIVEETREDVRLIEKRGGRVIFLRMPSGGEVLRAEESRYPRARYWDVLARGVGGPFIYFQDYPGLDRRCAEESHLNYVDAVPFTEALGKILAPLLRDRSATVPPPATAKTPPLPRD
jgi:hypothetical protein